MFNTVPPLLLSEKSQVPGSSLIILHVWSYLISQNNPVKLKLSWLVSWVLIDCKWQGWNSNPSLLASIAWFHDHYAIPRIGFRSRTSTLFGPDEYNELYSNLKCPKHSSGCIRKWFSINWISKVLNSLMKTA